MLADKELSLHLIVRTMGTSSTHTTTRTKEGMRAAEDHLMMGTMIVTTKKAEMKIQETTEAAGRGSQAGLVGPAAGMTVRAAEAVRMEDQRVLLDQTS